MQISKKYPNSQVPIVATTGDLIAALMDVPSNTPIFVERKAGGLSIAAAVTYDDDGPGCPAFIVLQAEQ